MAEWSIAPVLKTGVLRGTGGSNPSLSARSQCRTDDVSHPFCFCVYMSESELSTTDTKPPRLSACSTLFATVRHCSLIGVEPIDKLFIARPAVCAQMYRLYCFAVQIPPSPQDYEAKRYREIDTFCFYTFGASLLADRGVKNQKMGGLLLFAQLACKGPCGEQKGKALSGVTNGSVVANPSLYLLASRAIIISS